MTSPSENGHPNSCPLVDKRQSLLSNMKVSIKKIASSLLSRGRRILPFTARASALTRATRPSRSTKTIERLWMRFASAGRTLNYSILSLRRTMQRLESEGMRSKPKTADFPRFLKIRTMQKAPEGAFCLLVARGGTVPVPIGSYKVFKGPSLPLSRWGPVWVAFQ